MKQSEVNDITLKYRAQFLSRQKYWLGQWDKLFGSVAEKVARIASDPSARFHSSFVFNAKVKKLLDHITTDFSDYGYELSSEQISEAWKFAILKNSELVRKYYLAISEKFLPDAKCFVPNTDALKAFIERTYDSQTLSDRVWKIGQQLRGEMEIQLGIGIMNGDSAQVVSRRIRDNLKDPTALFRRVRDAKGRLIASEAMKRNAPGRGVYNSAYKNAYRVTRTETNQAFQLSDALKWQQLDMVTGIKISVSSQHRIYDVCDILEGTYPKGYMFLGWHCQCLCKAVPILMNEADFEEYLAHGTELSAEYISDVPNNYKSWVSDVGNHLKTTPRFMIENESFYKAVEQKFDYGKIDIAKEKAKIIDTSKSQIEAIRNQIRIFEKERSEIKSNLTFDKYIKNYNPNQEIPYEIERNGNIYKLHNKQKAWASSKIEAEYRMYKSEADSIEKLNAQIEKYKLKLESENQKLKAVTNGESDSLIKKSILAAKEEERSAIILSRFYPEKGLLDKITKGINKEYKGETFKAQSTNTHYIETKEGKIRISDHASRTEQDVSVGSKANNNRSVDFDTEDINITLDTDKNGVYVKISKDINEEIFYIHEYQIETEADLIEFILAKLKKM